MPFNSFAEPDNGPPRPRLPVWFAFNDERPLACITGIWTRWTLVAEVGAVHPKAMPVILRTPEEVDAWMSAPPAEALQLQRPLADGALQIVTKGPTEGRAITAAQHPNRREHRRLHGAESRGDFTVQLLDINAGATNASGTPGGYPTSWTQNPLTVSGLSAPMDCRIGFRYYLPNDNTDGTIVGIDTFSFVDPTTAPIAEPSSLARCSRRPLHHHEP